MAKRRGNHEGAIYQKKNGRWQAQISIEGNRLSKSFLSRKECAGWIREITGQKEKGLTFSSANLTFGEFFDQWLAIVKSRLRVKTWLQYRGIAIYELIPRLQKLKLVQLKPTEIQSLYAAKLG